MRLTLSLAQKLYFTVDPYNITVNPHRGDCLSVSSFLCSGARKAVNNEESSGEVGLFDHPASDLKIGGEAIQPLPSTLHGLLQTISELMLILPVGSSLQQIAMTCWGIKFKVSDHQFLHSSHVFSTISRILSKSESDQPPSPSHQDLSGIT